MYTSTCSTSGRHGPSVLHKVSDKRRVMDVHRRGGSVTVVCSTQSDREAESGSLQTVVASAPQIRFRKATDRARDQLADLAVLNERLSRADGVEAARARRRVDFMKRSRKTWAKVYDYVMDNDVECTLSAIEEANLKVLQMLDEQYKDRSSIDSMKTTLESLQAEVEEAQDRLQRTQKNIDANVERVNELKQTARILEQSFSPTNDILQEQVPGQSGKKNGLQSSLRLEPELKEHWFAVQFSSKLEENMMIPFDLFNEPWVLFRDSEGKAACVKDECAHRGCPISPGKVIDGEVACPYHGWQYDANGSCTKMPSTKMCPGIKVKALPIVEVDGLVWVWPGAQKPVGSPEGLGAHPEGFKLHAEIEVEVPVEHGLLIENLLDLAHAPFTHTSTFAKGWPIPDIVKFTANKALSGVWHPYPINMEFRPPCITVSTIGLAQPGKIKRDVTAEDCENHLHQIHFCLPSREGHTRLLYRMSMDFLGWLRYVPGIQNVWKHVAGQVLGEDLVLVVGQQDRLKRGGDTWAHPVSYDKMAVRYRRWRNRIAEDGHVSHTPVEASMSAGDLFELEE
ncbi:Chlorophyllide a oxygenase [Picochlorum sp. SENEW3]|nr:Chlorophyllide a oxygenase [Picochlorum sp. SENEW3]